MERITITLLLELYYVGVIEDSNILINIVIDARRQIEDATQTNLTLLAGFARQGRCPLCYFFVLLVSNLSILVGIIVPQLDSLSLVRRSQEGQ
ncbi:hypothetical protein YC2023_064325 [Brassica napus]